MSESASEGVSNVLGPRTDRIVDVALMCTLLFCSVVLNIGLAWKVSTLTKAINTTRSRSLLPIGTIVPQIHGQSVLGSPQTLNYGDVTVPTVLYAFTPQCGWCKKNLANLQALIKNSGSRYRVVGIALNKQDLPDYLEKEQLHFPVYTDIPASIQDRYRFGQTPTTIVVSSEGTVQKVWAGVYREGVRQEIEDYLHIQLPVTVP
jgi:peroxiredoxin